MFGKAYPTQCGKVAIYSMLATITSIFGQDLREGDVNESSTGSSDQKDKYTH
jgi:hypothetical protein